MDLILLNQADFLDYFIFGLLYQRSQNVLVILALSLQLLDILSHLLNYLLDAAVLQYTLLLQSLLLQLRHLYFAHHGIDHALFGCIFLVDRSLKRLLPLTEVIAQLF